MEKAEQPSSLREENTGDPIINTEVQTLRNNPNCDANESIVMSDADYSNECSCDDLNTVNSCDSDNFDNLPERYNTLKFLYTNARSLPPKILSLISMFDELELDFAAISETWMSDGARFEKNACKLEDSENLGIIRKSRSSRGGGVAILFNTRRMKLKQVKVKGNDFEIAAGIGRTHEDSRKLLIFSTYYPPQMKREKVEAMNRCISECIDLHKEKHDELVTIICGDVNKKDVSGILVDHPEVQVLDTPATRQGETLDLCLTSLPGECVRVRRFGPLTNMEGTPSDHDCMVVFCKSKRRHMFKKTTFNFRPYTKEGEAMFGAKLASIDWAPLYETDSDGAVDLMTGLLTGLYRDCFPEKTRTIKSSDQLWVTNRVRRMAAKKRRCYRKRGKSEHWKKIERETEAVVREAKLAFLDKSKRRVVEAKNSGSFFRAVNALKEKDPQPRWNIRSLFPGRQDKEIADECVGFFSQISKEFQPIAPPTPNGAPPWKIELHEISSRLKHCRKPKSLVDGDIPPALVTRFHDLLAVPLFCIYEKVLLSCKWPSQWKRETVKIIPKSAIPESLKDVRNISCTPLFSKVLEFFVLKRLRTMITLSSSQFGGIPGVGIDHFLCETWHEILTGLDSPGSAVNLTSIDFSKAFNRMDHHACVDALLRKGVDLPTVKVVQAFLHGRTMAVHINGAVSREESAPGGAPQGSVLGSFLFCATTDKLSNIDDMDTSMDFSHNGHEVSVHDDSDSEAPLSPIAPPEGERWNGIDMMSSSDEEEIWLGPRRPAQRLMDTTVESLRPSNSALEEFLELDDDSHVKPTIKAYIDDFNVVEKLRLSAAVGHYSEAQTTFQVRADKSERVFNSVQERAEEMKMTVNSSKTHLLCINPRGKQVTSFIKNLNGNTLKSGETLKILGFTFGCTPDVSVHTRLMMNRFASKMWGLRLLKRIGMSRSDLLFTYKTTLRPVAEFAAPSFHPILTREQTKSIERLQARSMKVIYGELVSYGTVLREGNIESLEDRRAQALKKFAIKASKSSRFGQTWFPRNHEIETNLRRRETYKIPIFKTERAAKSPIIAMRRLLNAE